MSSKFCEEVLDRHVLGEGGDVEVFADLGGERLVVGVVDEVEELDERREVVGAGLLVPRLGVGLGVVAAVAVVA